jgi:prolipoprotein diacylglyceryltransferase
VTSFSLLVGIGASLGLLQVIRRVPEQQALRWALAGLAVLAAGLVGARLNFAILHPGLFSADPLDVMHVWLGGLNWPGGLLFSLVALAIASLLMHEPFGLTADTLMPLFPAVAIMAWLGCIQAGCAYGGEIPETNSWALYLPDEQGSLAYRWPLQLVAAATLLILSWRVDRGSSGIDKYPGWQASAVGLALALHTLLFSWLRADHQLIYQGFRLDLAAGIMLSIICLIGLGWLGLLMLKSSFADKAPGANRESWFSPRE